MLQVFLTYGSGILAYSSLVFILGLAFASGLAATVTITHLLKAGDQIICMDDVYGGRWPLIQAVSTVILKTINWVLNYINIATWVIVYLFKIWWTPPCCSTFDKGGAETLGVYALELLIRLIV